MQKWPVSFIKVLFVFFTVFLFAACSEDVEGDGSSTLPSTGPGGAPIDNVPIQTVEATGFWVNILTDSQFPVLVNSATGVNAIGNDCFISAVDSNGNPTTKTSMDCFVDVNEGDLYIYELQIQYNAPPNLCTHVFVTPAWHWNYSAGIGPTEVNVAVDSTGSAPFVTSCTARDSSGVLGACSAHPELTDVGNTAGPSCIYNNHGPDGGTSCCYGRYDLTVTTEVEPGDFQVAESEVSWGQTSGTACIGGAGRTSWETTSTNGFPQTLILAVPENDDGSNVGLNDAITLTSNGSSSRSYFSTYASFYETTATPHSHDGYVSATTSSLPYSVNPVDDLDGNLFVTTTLNTNTTLPQGEPYFTFSCRDEGFEVIHEIRVHVREWNTLADFMLYETSAGLDYDPDVGGLTGVEGTACIPDSIFTGRLCNDFWDFGDILDNIGGAYSWTPRGS
ncbi:MAG: hypothetical protein AAF371_15685 [Pseudomonadota bacterium]